MILMVLGGMFLSLCVLAALFDVNQLRIPNWLNLLIAGLFVPAAAVSGVSPEMIGGHLMAGGLALLISAGLFALRVFGGGDAKMIPGVVLWLGPEAALPFTLKMVIVGGLCALLILIVRRFMPAEAIPGPVRAPFEPQAGVPYAVAIAAGAILTGAASPLLAELYRMAGFSG